MYEPLSLLPDLPTLPHPFPFPTFLDSYANCEQHVDDAYTLTIPKKLTRVWTCSFVRVTTSTGGVLIDVPGTRDFCSEEYLDGETAMGGFGVIAG